MRCIENHASPGFASVRMSGCATHGVGDEKQNHALHIDFPLLLSFLDPLNLKFQILHDQFLIRPPYWNLMTPDFNQVRTVSRYFIEIDDVRFMNTH